MASRRLAKGVVGADAAATTADKGGLPLPTRLLTVTPLLPVPPLLLPASWHPMAECD